MLSEHASRFPDGLSQKVFTQEYLPEAFPLSDPRMAGIQLGNLLRATPGHHTRSTSSWMDRSRET